MTAILHQERWAHALSVASQCRSWVASGAHCTQSSSAAGMPLDNSSFHQTVWFCLLKMGQQQIMTQSAWSKVIGFWTRQRKWQASLVKWHHWVFIQWIRLFLVVLRSPTSLELVLWPFCRRHSLVFVLALQSPACLALLWKRCCLRAVLSFSMPYSLSNEKGDLCPWFVVDMPAWDSSAADNFPTTNSCKLAVSTRNARRQYRECGLSALWISAWFEKMGKWYLKKGGLSERISE